MLLLINGAPGVGKSTLAARYADQHPLALIVDVDDLRRHLGRWAEVDESKLVARDLAVALVEAHLARGHDVVVPQYLGRPEFRERLRDIADGAGVPFVEVVLTDDANTVIHRFTGRRLDHARAGVAHPEADLADDAIGPDISRAIEHLESDARTRGVPVISAAGGIDAADAALRACLPA
jgi:predicted kinase